jgi:pimeloyl-ACP methyl ester carboxylesterase
MVPVSFDGCFGWLHTSKFEMGSTAVVLCPGLKMDELTGYSTFRLLADAFADHGFPTLRLHYFGTGDSRDPDGTVEYPATWLQDIHGSIEWLREHCGAERFALCGFRFGATLAAMVAASRSDVAGLILLAPVIRGRSYIRQLMIETSPGTDGSIDAGRFRLSPATITLIKQIELRKLPLHPACKLAVHSRRSAALTECEVAWKRMGIDASVTDFAGLEPMLRPSFAIHEGVAVVDPIVRWICRSLSNCGCPKQHGPLEPVQMIGRDWIETPLFFGADRSLFGVLCRPRHRETNLVVLMVNPSGDPHCAGTTVDVARFLAAAGVASLRIDFAGLGDSQWIGYQHVFETDRGHDCSAAIDALECLGYDTFAVYGLCSGAYHAYHAAAKDPRLAFALLVNLPFFKWTPGFPLEDLIFDVRKPTYFVRKMSTKAFWRTFGHKLLHGELNIRTRFAWLERKLRKLPGFAQDATDATSLAKRVRMLFLVSPGDISLEILRREFGLRTPVGSKIELVPDLNHTMSESRMRKIVADRVVSFLNRDAVTHDANVTEKAQSPLQERGRPVLAGRILN